MARTPSEIDSLLESMGLLATRPRATADGGPSPLATHELRQSPHELRSPHCRPSRESEPEAPPVQPEPLLLTLPSSRFVPRAPQTLQETGLTAEEIINLILKYLAARAVDTGYQIANHVGLRYPLVESLLRQLKIDRLVAYKSSVAGRDYLYELTDAGREQARRLSHSCTYFGTAPVTLEDYIKSVNAQSLQGRRPSLEAIREAFSEIQVSDDMLSNVGQAIHSGRGMFLFGPAGNGKTSMAERVTRSFGDSIWVPRCISASGELIRLFDPNRHRPIQDRDLDQETIDGRWVQIERPTIIAGGELRMEDLEITYIRNLGLGEAPLQMKANCGTLLIDDFGRQRISTDELLNRWIVPLEQRYDYLHLESGRTIQVPFDELVIFSSNLEPKDIVDEAFLRRIPYKIEVQNPTEEEFRKLFLISARKMKMILAEHVLTHLIQRHYREADREFRFCHPRDLLWQVENRCSLHQLPREVTVEAIDHAVRNYFSIM